MDNLDRLPQGGQFTLGLAHGLGGEIDPPPWASLRSRLWTRLTGSMISRSAASDGVWATARAH